MLGILKVVDKYSLLRALIVAKNKADIAYFHLKWRGIDKQDIPQSDVGYLKAMMSLNNNLVANRRDYQFKLLVRFAEQVRMPLKDHYELDDLKHIQRELNVLYGKSIYRIHLFNITEAGECIHEWSGASMSERNIIIYRQGTNFDVPKNLKRMRKDTFFCVNCLKSSRYSYRHRCDSTCVNCGISTLICNSSSNSDYRKECEKCHIFFLSEQCYKRHCKKDKRGMARCQNINFCVECAHFFNVKNFAPGEIHRCGFDYFCRTCARHVERSKLHTCYTRMPSDSQKKKWREREQQVKVLVYDYECSQAVEKEDGTFDYLRNHEVVLAVARKACFHCFDATLADVDAPCDRCGVKEHIVSYSNSDNVISDFVDWLFRPEHDGAYLYAHFGGMYDYVLTLCEFVRKDIIPDIILRGRRVITGTVTHNGCTLHIRDSFNLIPVALSKFPAAFGLEGAKKGFFPYFLIEKKWFHTRQHGMPPLHYYNTGGQSPEALKEFLAWYNKHNTEQNVFDFDQEILDYGRNDVKILLQGLLEYRKTIIQLTTWDPIPNACTLPALTSHILRCNHIPPLTLCNTPDAGFSFNRQQSDLCIRWLRWEMEATGEHIHHAENGGEKRVTVPGLSTFVDGFCIRKSDGAVILYDLSGCYVHGCKCCHDPKDMNKLQKQTFGVLYAATTDRLEKLRSVYRVEHLWECQLRRLLSRNKVQREFFSNCHSSRLNLRSAMQGGRVDAHVISAKSDAENVIVYLDFISLYPHIMRSCELPIGAPFVKRSDFPPVPATEFCFKGIGHIRILPPLSLRYPLLAVKMSNNLKFITCRTCALKKSSKKCNHTVDERAIVGSWSHFEIQKALSLNYIILDFFEIWIYSKWSTTLFTDYINTFYKVKTASSGWPYGVESHEDKLKCLAEYKETMGIELSIDDIKKNNSYRSVSKMILNASWGKLSQRIELKKTIFCDGDQLSDLLDTKMSQISTYRQLKDDLFIVSINTIPEEARPNATGNLPIGITITSHARLLLYSLLERSQGRACYNDTDSIIALVPRNANPFSDLIGNSIGQLQIETPGKEILQGLFGGPKAYALKLVDLKTGEISYIVKIRGISLDSDASKIINFESLERLIIGKGLKEELVTTRLNLKRSTSGVVTVPEIKRYKTVYDKGYVLKGHVYPHGYYPEDEEPDMEECTPSPDAMSDDEYGNAEEEDVTINPLIDGNTL